MTTIRVDPRSPLGEYMLAAAGLEHDEELPMATEYLVLMWTANGDEPESGGFRPHKTMEASSGEQACRKAAAEMGEDALEKGVVFAAAPKRSWHEQGFKLETQRKLTGFDAAGTTGHSND